MRKISGVIRKISGEMRKIFIWILFLSGIMITVVKNVGHDHIYTNIKKRI